MSDINEVYQIAEQQAVVGEFQDTITRYDESDNVVEVQEMPVQHNMITVPISTLMAGLIQGTFQGNYSFWAVGEGQTASSPYLTNLVREYSRKQVTISFVDGNNALSQVPTNRIMMTVAWAKGELGNVNLTEFGIFSGTNANQPNGGLMLDYVPHQPIGMTDTMALSRKIYFTF